jgi:hypothetical protein
VRPQSRAWPLLFLCAGSAARPRNPNTVEPLGAEAAREDPILVQSFANLRKPAAVMSASQIARFAR